MNKEEVPAQGGRGGVGGGGAMNTILPPSTIRQKYEPTPILEKAPPDIFLKRAEEIEQIVKEITEDTGEGLRGLYDC